MTEHSAWSQLPWLGFDTETTGVNVTSDRLVTAALVLRPGGATPQGSDTVRTWLADPGVSIPDGAAAVHGITTEYAREHGAPGDDAGRAGGSVAGVGGAGTVPA